MVNCLTQQKASITFLLTTICWFIEGDAVNIAKMLADSGSKNTVKVLKGGYELFSGMYPFLRTQQIIYMPKVSDRSIYYSLEPETRFDVFPDNLFLIANKGSRTTENLSKRDHTGIIVFGQLESCKPSIC
jgi:hypothetical protein